MSESRRNFFKRFLGQDDSLATKRAARYQALETYARTQFFPYDFPLSTDQERELLASIRYTLERASNETLFSNAIRAKIEEVVEKKLNPWRQNGYSEARAERLREVRTVAQDYVSTFLFSETESVTVEKLKETYGINDLYELEAMLREQMQVWINQADDRLIEQCDVITVKDLVFAQLRSWC